MSAVCDVLFQARFNDVTVTVGHASPGEIDALTGPEGFTEDLAVIDVLNVWNLIAIRSSLRTTIHGLGWRVLLGNTYITSPLIAIGGPHGIIVTTSKKGYALAVQDESELDPELRSHLGYALRTWGFENIRP